MHACAYNELVLICFHLHVVQHSTRQFRLACSLVHWWTTLYMYRVLVWIRHRAHWLPPRMILLAWFEYLEQSSSYKEVQLQMFCPHVKNIFPPPEEVIETLACRSSFVWLCFILTFLWNTHYMYILVIFIVKWKIPLTVDCMVLCLVAMLKSLLITIVIHMQGCK